MRKILSRLLSVVLFAASVSGLLACGDNYKATSNEIIVMMNRTDFKTTVYKDAKTQFESAFADKGWTVTFETKYDYEGGMSTAMMGGTYGDVLLVPNALESTSYSKYLRPFGKISSLEDEWNWISTKAYDGEVYGLPTYGVTNGILYNKKVFTAAGVTTVPSTREEFLEAMQKIKTWGTSAANPRQSTFKVPYYTNFKADWPLDQWSGGIMAAAGNENYMNNVLPWDNSAFKPGNVMYNSYKLLYDLVKEGYTETDYLNTLWENSKVYFVNGDVAAMTVGSWAIPQMKDIANGKIPSDAQGEFSSGDIVAGAINDIGYMPYPYKDSQGKQYAQVSADYCIGIAKNTKNREASDAFVEWFLNDFKYFDKCDGLPPMKGAAIPDGSAAKSFTDLGVILLEEKPAVKEGALSLAESKTLAPSVGVWSSSWKRQFVEEAAKNRAGGAGGGKTYDEICATLQTSWDLGVAAVKIKYGNQP